MLIPVRRLGEVLIEEMTRVHGTHWTSEAEYVKLAGLNEDIIGAFNPGDALRFTNVFSHVTTMLAMGPSARDLRRMILALHEANGSLLVESGAVDAELFRLALHAVPKKNP